MNNKLLARIAWGLCLLVGIVLSLKSLREPDLWWMYRTGEWMLENGAVTKSDPFSYTFLGTEWINVKWFFEVLITSVKNVLGVEGVFVLQAGVTLGILTLVYQSANLIRVRFGLDSSTHKKPFVGLILAALLMLLTIDYRLIGRPEMTSHLMTTAYLYLFWRWHYQPSKAIYALIPLQLLWTNMHEAFGTGMVLMLAYLITVWVQYIYFNTGKQKIVAPKQLSLAVLGALIVIPINPRGIQMLTHPFEIFGQLSSNQYTTELAPIWKDLYWQEMHAYLNIAFITIVVGFILLGARVVKTEKRKVPKNKLLLWLEELGSQFGLGNLVLVAMLGYLSITAYRNIPFFILAATPILAVALETLLVKIKRENLLYIGTVVVGIVFYGSIITGNYHEWTNSRDRYGLQVLSSHNPVGAAKFIEEKGIKGRCFSDYLTSSYLLWRLQPDFKTYIDLRDLDIFPTDFFEDFARTMSNPALFEEKDSIYNFDYVVIYRPKFQYLQKYLLESPNYDLVFVDAVASVYVKNTETNAQLIENYGFAKNKAPDIFAYLPEEPSSGIGYVISKLFNPLYQPTDYSDARQDIIAGSYYMNIKNPRLALQRANNHLQKTSAYSWEAYELYGNIYNYLAFAAQTPDSIRAGYIQQARTAYNQALMEKPTHASAIIGKATLAMQQGSFSAAITLLQEARAIDATNPVLVEYLTVCYKNLAFQNGQNKGSVEKWLEYALLWEREQPNNPMALLDIGIAYCLLNDCGNAVYYLNQVKDLPNLPVEEMKTAQKCLQSCSL